MMASKSIQYVMFRNGIFTQQALISPKESSPPPFHLTIMKGFGIAMYTSLLMMKCQKRCVAIYSLWRCLKTIFFHRVVY